MKDQHQIVLLCAFKLLNSLYPQLTEVGAKFIVHAAIEERDITLTRKTDYKVATMVALDDLKDAKKGVRFRFPLQLSRC